MRKSKHRKALTARLYIETPAEGPNVKVLFSCAETLRIGSSLGHRTFALDPGQTEYEHAGERRKAMYYKNPIIDGTLRNQWFSSNMDDPDNFRYIEMRIANVEPSEDLHNLTIPFSIDKAKYVAHLSVKVEVHTIYEHRINVPGTP